MRPYSQGVEQFEANALFFVQSGDDVGLNLEAFDSFDGLEPFEGVGTFRVHGDLETALGDRILILEDPGVADFDRVWGKVRERITEERLDVAFPSARHAEICVEGVGVGEFDLFPEGGEGDFTEREKILKRFKAEDNVVFGEIAMIDRENRSASVVTTTDCILLEIRREDLLDLIEKRPQMGIKILKRIAQLLASRLRQSSQDVIRLTTALSVALSG